VEGGKPENKRISLGARQEVTKTNVCHQARAILVGGDHSHHCTIPAPLLIFSA